MLFLIRFLNATKRTKHVFFVFKIEPSMDLLGFAELFLGLFRFYIKAFWPSPSLEEGLWRFVPYVQTLETGYGHANSCSEANPHGWKTDEHPVWRSFSWTKEGRAEGTDFDHATSRSLFMTGPRYSTQNTARMQKGKLKGGVFVIRGHCLFLYLLCFFYCFDICCLPFWLCFCLSSHFLGLL